MAGPTLHCFELDGRNYAMDPESCFCFECDAISRDVLAHYPHTPVNRILHLLEEKHSRTELEEVIGELEWLRSAKSIAQAMKVADLEKLYAAAGGLKAISVAWNGQRQATNLVAARGLLLGRCGNETELSIELRCGNSVADVRELAALLNAWPAEARLAGKRLSLGFATRLSQKRDTPATLSEHRLDLAFQPDTAAPIESLLLDFNKALQASTLSGLAKWAAGLDKAHGLRIILRPTHGRFGGAAKALRELGFAHIEIDGEAPFLGAQPPTPHEHFASMRENAEYYAQALLKRDLFRLDPIAGLFLRIYQGTPLRRADPAGTQALAVDESTPGQVYPAEEFVGLPGMSLGTLSDNTLDETLLAQFENVGSVTTAACVSCWARNLCGGGSAAVHLRRSGSCHEPETAWCDGQRGWMEAAIAAFNRLSTAGVNFVQVYESLGRRPKVSLWQAAKTLMNAPLGLRPLAEADAPLITRWENWNEAAYFVAHEAGVLITNHYDREMDAVHPKGYEQEFLLTSSKGSPMGLLRLRPMLVGGAAQAWLYFHDATEYQSSATRKGFRNLIDLLPSQQSFTRLLVPAGPKDGGLALFLQAAGFQSAGIQRDALFLHGGYHDLQWFSMELKPAK